MSRRDHPYNPFGPSQYSVNTSGPYPLSLPQTPAPPPQTATPPLVTQGIQVTSSFYLRVTHWGSLAGVTLQLNYRIEQAGTVPKILSKQFTADSARTSGGTVNEYALNNGVLTYAAVAVVGGSPKRGQIFFKLSLHESQGGPAQKLGAGYAVVAREQSWPPVFDEDPLGGTGFRYKPTITNPGGGLEINVQTPMRALWKIEDVSFQFHPTSAGTKTIDGIAVNDYPAGNRLYQNLRPGTAYIVAGTHAKPPAGMAGTVSTFYGVPGYAVREGSFDQQRLVGTANVIPSVRIILPAWLQTHGLPGSYSLRTQTGRGILNDVWTVFSLNVEEFIDPS